MNTSSFFVKNRALFGSYPSQEEVEELEQNNVRYFIDLTCEGETGIVPYTTNHTYIKYPIIDRKIPAEWRSFAQFILKIADIIRSLKNDEKIYVHCKGGHGRAGIVVACILCHMGGYTPERALELTTKYHGHREIMKDKWRKIGSPQTYMQKQFVYKFFEPLFFYRAYKTGYTKGLSNFSLHEVKTELGTFPTSEAAFQAYKEPDNPEYVQKQEEVKYPALSKQFGRRCKLREDWHAERDNIMYYVLRCKFSQHDDIRENLLNTGLRPIVEKSAMDCYWGCGEDGKGMNKLGHLLMKLRNEMYISCIEETEEEELEHISNSKIQTIPGASVLST